MGDQMALSAITSALDGLAMRQRIIADNVANMQTPGFRSTSVSFEESLRSALEGGNPNFRGDDVISSAVSNEAFVTDENGRVVGSNVNLERETLLGMEANLKYQLMVQAYNNSVNHVRDVLRTN